jgi:hypothetical protein
MVRKENNEFGEIQVYRWPDGNVSFVFGASGSTEALAALDALGQVELERIQTVPTYTPVIVTLRAVNGASPVLGSAALDCDEFHRLCNEQGLLPLVTEGGDGQASSH